MPSLLVADDMAIVRSKVRNIIRRENLDFYPIAEACNGEEAVSLADQMQPDIILMDIRMPALDGLQAASTIRAKQPDVKIVVLSAYHEFAYVRQALKLGATDYLLKPIRPSKLVSFLTQIQAQIQREKNEPLRSKDAKQIEQTLLESVRLGQSQTSFELMATLTDDLLDDPEKPSETIQAHFLRLMLLLSKVVIDLGASATEVATISQRHMIELFSSSTPTGLRNWTLTYLSNLTALNQATAQDTDPVQKALKFIDEHHSKPDLTLKDVAQAVNLSSSHLAALLRSRVGISYKTYLTARRIEHAKTLLQTSDLTVADVAQAIGYQTVSNFYRLFQRETGLTPTVYRNC